MFRGEDDIQYILYQRRKLDQTPFLAELKGAIDAFQPGLDYGLALAYQGFNSLKFTEFALALQPLFPTLAPQDFYRYKTISQLIDRFGVASTARPLSVQGARQHEVVIAGMSCRFPAAVETLTQFWDTLAGGSDQVRLETGRGAAEAGFLSPPTSRFDHRFFNISQVEAGTMDPQQILALELTEMLWRDAGIDPQTVDRRRVGVYMGVWSQEYHGDPTSVYYPSGTNPSIVAARISYHYDLRGPSWVSNTACSSSLVAVHYAAKDIEAGRVDFAIAGGVNMLLDEAFTNAMGNSGFLSSDHRCKAFDDAANGYVRAEGGGLVLLVNKSLVDRYYAELTGSAINQNGGRSQVITAPHPEAQEELIEAACRDAGIAPQEIAYVECHGTGTKIGDPIEMSAILNTIAKERPDTCYVGSVKSNIGHLESAAGIAGLIKAVVALNHGVIPPNLHFRQPNQHIDFAANPVEVVVEATPIDRQANVGVSSFGFGGSNAHLILRGAETAMRKEIEPLAVPFDRERAAALDNYVSLVETPSGSPAEIAPTVDADPDVRQTIRTLLFSVTGVESIEPDIELLDQGLDSMSATEMIRHLEELFEVEIEPDVLFEFPLFDQFAEEIERRIRQQPADGMPIPVTRASVEQLVNDLFLQLTHIEAIDPDIELTDQGLDSMSGTELISQLENALGIDIGPEILFEYPLKEQFVDEVFTLAGRLN
jgi:3-oxoacyl-(acyl-carrier-protein) synthase/acyl carrier protein